MEDWSVQDGKLIGGLISIHGIGNKTAADIIKRRKEGIPYTKSQQRMLDEGKTPWDNLFEGAQRFGDYYKNPEKYGIHDQITYLKNINVTDGRYTFIGKLKEKNLRDLNEYGNLVKRNGKIIESNNLFLNMVMEDDTDKMICTIGRFQYEKLGKPIIESGAIGDWFVVHGEIKNGFRKIMVIEIKPLKENEKVKLKRAVLQKSAV